MQQTRRSPRWGCLCALALLMSLASVAGADDGRFMLMLPTPTRLSQLVTMLSMQGGQQVILDKLEHDPMLSVNFPMQSLEQHVAQLSKLANLDYWKVGEAFHIGKSSPRVVDVLPTIDEAPSLPAMLTPTSRPNEPRIRKIELAHTSAIEMAWMLGYGDNAIKDPSRMQVMTGRINSALGINTQPTYRTGDNFTSPAMSNPLSITPVMSTGGDSMTGKQMPPWLAGTPGATDLGGTDDMGISPFGATNPTATPTGTSGAVTRAPSRGLNLNDSNPLRDFVPEGIHSIVGLTGLNALLVKAEDDATIDKLEQLIKLLDQPVKQAVVEALVVSMDLSDASSFGVSWDFGAPPYTLQSTNTEYPANLAFRYVKGNFRLKLAAAASENKATVTNAPRVIVQNNGSASFMTQISTPFIIPVSSTDSYGRVTNNVTIQSQTTNQGLTVNRITIHPDNTVTLDITPQLTSRNAGIAASGGGTISATTTNSVRAVVRVKSGDTIMLGGFTGRDDIVDTSKTPFFADIPIIGPLLFSSKRKSYTTKELMIFVTPTVLKDDSTDFGGLGGLPVLF